MVTLLFVLILFLSGMGGLLLFRTNLLLVIMCLEILFFSLSLNFVLSAYFLDDILGEVFFLYILTVAGAESGVGLAILVAYYRLRGEVWLDMINKLKG